MITTGAQCALLTKTFAVMQRALITCFCLNKPCKDWNIAAGLGSCHFPGFIFAATPNNEASSLVESSLHWPGFAVCTDGGLRSAWGTLDGACSQWDFSTKFFSYFEEPSSTYFLPLFLSHMLLTHILDKVLWTSTLEDVKKKRKSLHPSKILSDDLVHKSFCQFTDH